jgi:hypothetical protein
VLAAGGVLVAAGPYRERILPSYATNLAAAGMTRARLVANAAYDFYQFYHEPRARVKAAPVVDTSFADLDPAAAATPPVAMPGVVTASGASSGLAPNGLVPYSSASVVQQGATPPQPAGASLAQAAAGPSAHDSASAAHNWLRANGDSGAAQPLAPNATDDDRIRRLGDELRGHAARANQFMTHGDLPHVRSELHDLASEAQLFRSLYPAAADSIHVDQLVRTANGRLYETCQAAFADSTVSLPPGFSCVQIVPNGRR